MAKGMAAEDLPSGVSNMNNTSPSSLDYGEDAPLHYLGPQLSDGPLPAIFYFSLSSTESLGLDPFNQPAVYLANRRCRVFSLTLPFHEHAYPHKGAMSRWIKAIAEGNDILAKFSMNCTAALDFLIDRQLVTPAHVAAAGLSRGAFAAAAFAANDSRVKYWLGFAPLTNMKTLTDFDPSLPLLPEMSLESTIPQLASKTTRLYIGNRDKVVDTQECCTFFHALVNASYAHNHRSPPVELIIYPSIGHKGHGTPPHIFDAGAEWLAMR